MNRILLMIPQIINLSKVNYLIPKFEKLITRDPYKLLALLYRYNEGDPLKQALPAPHDGFVFDKAYSVPENDPI